MRSFTIKLSLMLVFCLSVAACGNQKDNKQKHTINNSAKTTAQPSSANNNNQQHKSVAANKDSVANKVENKKQPVEAIKTPAKHAAVNASENNSAASSSTAHKQKKALSAKLAKELLHRLRSYTNMSADFNEFVVNHSKNGDTEELHRGHMDLKRPDKFIWKTFRGKQNEKIDEELIGNGGIYWQYDPLLQQAIKRRVDLNKQPLIKLLLSDEGSSMDLSRNFDVAKKTMHDDPGAVVFVLTSIQGNDESSLANMTIVLKNNMLSQLILNNTLNQQTIFQFYNIKKDPINNDVFVFKPGDDIDVVDNT